MIAAVFAPGSHSGTLKFKWDSATDPHANDAPTFGWSMTFDPGLSDEVLIALLEQIIEATREHST
jgi:hypothetical protein